MPTRQVRLGDDGQLIVETSKTKRSPITKRKVSRLEPTTNGHWLFPEQMARNGEIGFVYVIRDKEAGKYYLGKKKYVGAGKLNKGVESNWASYKTSSKVLIERIKRLGKASFDFIVLEQYFKSGALSYAETWSLCHVEAPTTDLWHNKRIEKIAWPFIDPISQRHRERLDLVLTDHSFENERIEDER